MNLDYDPAPRLPISPGERTVVLLLSVGFLGLVAADLAHGFSPRKLSAFFVLSFWGPLLGLHEIAHALAARAVGWRVSEMAIGIGRELVRFRIGQTRVRVAALPIEGYVVPSPNTLERARLKQAWIYAAGPLSQLCLCGVACWLLDFRLPAETDSLGRIALESLAAAAGLGALLTLLPYRTGGHASDGLGLLSSCFTSDSSFQERLAAPFLSEARRLLLREQLSLAEQRIAAGLEQFPGDARLTGLLAVCQAAAGRAQQAYATLESLGPVEQREPLVRAALLADAAWAVLVASDQELYSEAQRALQQALELAPGETHYQVLMGRTHLEQGRPEQAYAFLMSAYKRVRDVDQESQCVAHLALACVVLRRSPAAARIASYAPRFLDAVESHDVPPALRERVHRAVNDS